MTVLVESIDLPAQSLRGSKRRSNPEKGLGRVSLNRRLRILSSISGLILATLLPGCTRAQAWADVDIQGFDSRTSYPALAINTDGVPFMLYIDEAVSGKHSMAKFEKGAWVRTGPQGFAQLGFGDSFALDATGIPYVAYIEVTTENERKLCVIKLEGDAWIPMGIPIILTRGGYTRSIALDTTGVPYVAYSHFDNGPKLSVVKLERGAWIPVGPPIFSKGIASPSLALDAAGIPYIAYRDLNNGSKVSVVKLEKDAWISVGPLGFSPNRIEHPSLAVDAAGIPYVTYRNTKHRLSVMKYKGGNWVFVGPPDASPKSAYFPSMMLGAAGVPYVAYMNCVSFPLAHCTFKFRMTKFEGGAWIPVGPPDFSPEKAEPPPSVQKK